MRSHQVHEGVLRLRRRQDDRGHRRNEGVPGPGARRRAGCPGDHRGPVVQASSRLAALDTAPAPSSRVSGPGPRRRQRLDHVLRHLAPAAGLVDDLDVLRALTRVRRALSRSLRSARPLDDVDDRRRLGGSARRRPWLAAGRRPARRARPGPTSSGALGTACLVTTHRRQFNGAGYGCRPATSLSQNGYGKKPNA